MENGADMEVEIKWSSNEDKWFRTRHMAWQMHRSITDTEREADKRGRIKVTKNSHPLASWVKEHHWIYNAASCFAITLLKGHLSKNAEDFFFSFFLSQSSHTHTHLLSASCLISSLVVALPQAWQPGPSEAEDYSLPVYQQAVIHYHHQTPERRWHHHRALRTQHASLSGFWTRLSSN